MSVHPFPARRILRHAGMTHCAADIVEPILVAGLVLTTAAQVGLWVWFWLL